MANISQGGPNRLRRTAAASTSVAMLLAAATFEAATDLCATASADRRPGGPDVQADCSARASSSALASTASGTVTMRRPSRFKT